MIEDKLRELAGLKSEFGEDLNKGASDSEILALKQKANAELSAELPDAYLQLLRKVNGFEWNGFILYGVDEELAESKPLQKIYGVVENNLTWYENEWNKAYIFFGESNSSWYVQELATKAYWILDLPSGRSMKEFPTFEGMITEMIESSL